MIQHPSQRTAFTMIEVFIVVVIIGVLVGLLLPSVQSAREMARRTSCANNFTQIALATQSYHGAFDQYPVQLSGTDGSTVPGEDNDMRLSAFVALLPFLDQYALFERIQGPLDATWGWGTGDSFSQTFDIDETTADKKSVTTWIAGGPSPSESNYGPWLIDIPVLRCPSDPGIGGYGRNNYGLCIGDAMVAGNTGPMKDVNGKFEFDESLAEQTSASMRGIFVPRQATRRSDVTDGLAYTILMGEIATDLGDNDVRTFPMAVSETVLRDNLNAATDTLLYDQTRPQFWDPGKIPSKIAAIASARRGLRWSDGMPLYTSVTTNLPPNRELVVSADLDDAWAVAPSSSRHQGGAHVAFANGVVRFITDTIDAGITSQPSVYVGSDNAPGSESVFGVWGAMGTRASSELAANQSNVFDATD